MKSGPLKHGHARKGRHSATYESWTDMKKRCHTPTATAYKNYGGRGIRVCVQWMEFAAFLKDMGECPPGLTIDRIDNDGNYEPGNCRWADMKTQRNNRRDSVRVTAFGKTKTIREWAESRGLPYNTVYLRLKRGATPEQAVTRPWYSRTHQSPESRSRKPKS